MVPGIANLDSWYYCYFIINGSEFILGKAFGEFEFWFALIKVVTIILMIIAVLVIFFGFGNGGHAVGISNLWTNDLCQMVLLVSSCIINCNGSYQGVELIGITAGETKDPQKILLKQ